MGQGYLECQKMGRNNFKCICIYDICSSIHSSFSADARSAGDATQLLSNALYEAIAGPQFDLVGNFSPS